jgi:hypothetical protein
MPAFSSRQIVVLVCAVSAAAVLAPVGVMAATGTIVNITDPVSATRKARVTTAGALQVEQRAGVPASARNVSITDIRSLATYPLVQAVGPSRMGVGELMVAVHNTGTPVDEPTIADLTYFLRGAGVTTACGRDGWAPTLLRRVTVRTDTTVQLNFTGPPLVVPAPPSGRTACVAVRLYQWVSQTLVDVGATVWTYQ